MIDLTKPIRRKPGIKQQGCGWSDVLTCKKIFRVEAQDGSFNPEYYSLRELEHYFENIPEPRRPRDFLALEDAHNVSFVSIVPNTPDAFLDTKSRIPWGSVKMIRLIEWPADAPLPEWPE